MSASDHVCQDGPRAVLWPWILRRARRYKRHEELP
jgi:hypothetical protein